MVLSTVITFSLALWIVLWALGLGGFVGFLIPLAIILSAVALHVVRSRDASGGR